MSVFAEAWTDGRLVPVLHVGGEPNSANLLHAPQPYTHQRSSSSNSHRRQQTRWAREAGNMAQWHMHQQQQQHMHMAQHPYPTPQQTLPPTQTPPAADTPSAQAEV